ncbi:alpha/beta fold hydrolase [Belnapia sp. T6]|uniref:Alpha/beta fold hydrolase n=1 Tax=Belnapia mucosa TaxID=2804532 RepID=A0ABS1V1X8_9PROT|nr:alpha/beta fold hydrolase [Belnapia mucosa]
MRRIAGMVVALLALAAIGLGGWRLHAAREGVVVAPLALGEIPARVFRLAAETAGPVVVLAHGFAGSQQMMQAFAVTLARGGYVAVTFDFPGHGRNPVPLAGGLSDDRAAAGALLAALGRVVEAARGLGDGRLALLGHSMAADIAVRFAFGREDVAATVAVSGFGPEVTAERPRNLLLLVGAWEPEFLRDAARRLAGAGAERVTAGRFEEGTGAAVCARRGRRAYRHPLRPGCAGGIARLARWRVRAGGEWVPRYPRRGAGLAVRRAAGAGLAAVDAAAAGGGRGRGWGDEVAALLAGRAGAGGGDAAAAAAGAGAVPAAAARRLPRAALRALWGSDRAAAVVAGRGVERGAAGAGRARGHRRCGLCDARLRRGDRPAADELPAGGDAGLAGAGNAVWDAALVPRG